MTALALKQRAPVSVATVLDALREVGIAPAFPDRLRLDGSLCRFDVEGARAGRRHGWLVAHLDGARPVLVVGDWRSGDHHVLPLGGQPIDEAERKRWQREVAQARRQREWEIAGRHRKVRTAAVDLWEAASPAYCQHGYLATKQLPAAGLRESGRCLLVPMRDTAGRLWNLQRIRTDGVKRYLRDGRVVGLYCPVGRLTAPTPSGGWTSEPVTHLLIAEGWATAMALHLSTGLPCAAALSAHNLEAVARALRQKYPRARLTVCADHDPVGIDKARAAAALVRGHLAIPPEAGADWWDVWNRSGADRVASAQM